MRADKGIFFLLLSIVCFYLVLEEIYGQKIVTSFVKAIIPKSTELDTDLRSSVHTSSGREHGGSGRQF